MAQCVNQLTADGSMWVMICDEWADAFGLILDEVGLIRRAWVKWYETFGVNCSNNFNRCSRHLFYCVVDPKKFVFNREAVSRPSDRQTKYQDKRADPSGKILDDVWQVPRLVDNSPERVPGFPTQVPLEITRRIAGCCSEPGDLIVDPFNGSASTGAAVLEIGQGRRYVGIEKEERFCKLARLRLGSISCAHDATQKPSRNKPQRDASAAGKG
jgi:site-specific DNA-methyltransferase (adenine-specific)